MRQLDLRAFIEAHYRDIDRIFFGASGITLLPTPKAVDALSSSQEDLLLRRHGFSSFSDRVPVMDVEGTTQTQLLFLKLCGAAYIVAARRLGLSFQRRFAASSSKSGQMAVVTIDDTMLRSLQRVIDSHTEGLYEGDVCLTPVTLGRESPNSAHNDRTSAGPISSSAPV